MGYKLKEPVEISCIAEKFGLKIVGNESEVFGVSSICNLQSNELSFSTKKIEINVPATVIIPERFIENKSFISYLVSENPRLDFIRILGFLEKTVGFTSYDFESKIDSTVKLGRNVVIENGCEISEGVIIEHNVVIHAGTKIGKNSRIRSCSSIGGDGFGFERLTDGEPLRFPHLGGVLIGENVEIGSCTTIARGTLSDTIIEDFVKVDNLVHIAHNCHIKKNAFIIACAELSGGVSIGENAWIAPNSCVNQKITIGTNSLVGLGAVVTKNVEDFTVVAGNPAKKIRDLKA